MFEGLENSQLTAAIEALLFISNEPVNTITLASMLEIEPSEALVALEELRAQLERDERGIQLVEIAGGWRLYSHPVFDELLEKYVISWDTRRMSQAALEVLAIVAYGQPITRAQVSAIRGVNSDSVMNTLLDRALVREAGVADAPGNPVLYATTNAFLEKFGLGSCADLPPLEDYAPDEKTVQLIRERLGAPKLEAQPDADQVAAGVRALEENVAASAFGVVEKIDFDSLTFDTDSE